MSLNPVNVVAGQTVLMIHARVRNYELQMTNYDHTIRFSLYPNPLSELADGEGNGIGDAKLSIADAGGNGEMVKWRNGEIELLSVYPNPAKDLLNVEYQMSGDSHCEFQLMNMHGTVVSHMQIDDVTSGLNKARLDVSNLPNGVYMMKVVAGEIVRVVKVVVNR
jgi:hypothetical protein